MYKTNYTIIDQQDKNRYYKRGETYPAKGSKATDERVQELLEKGHISLIEEPKKGDIDSLEELTVKELKEIAKDKGLEGYSDLKKDELIELLEKE